ncbi:YhdH/YhfP family quinone oxidoreductase [Desulfococcus multivorans]|uniref:Quinone oxidoreductase, YhdH/YhfP family n=2 Tax=Desulfococcus multivorans TaxID=897 RepID=S7TY17_DESML|nr:YhdH/YhfP family quinone oxidoreductase [Desulfococcus multivorans]AOY57393.1 quinone oxidoreductase [Desulfococcus multivorans]AQU99835.1 oxidoreductase [Desulfococcus multivorans]EPR42021.1 quinone oxidoreductase, YhdH/YhfP family [Desulfococcus multivorans DSM 2059]CAJ13747.1 alcohol dehydrogenase, zinc-containing [Desulfococcus multivorans]SKA10062.1 putative quinone oxidoreductase, YhdH/YhfP family [Desulfococcus multivorans DSM 2059]
MTQKRFKAMWVEEIERNRFKRTIIERTTDDLPDGDVLIRVRYSSLNYKDALSAVGNRGVTRKYPHTPGIDAAGTVEESRVDAVKAGDEVIVTSYDLGMNTPGGFGQYIRVPAAWVVPRPDGLSLRESMAFGTAGFTAGLSIHYLTHGVSPDRGEILVTGATGGVGSLSVAMLAKLGYSVTAATGKTDAADFLKAIGAREIISRSAALDTSEKPLLKGRWAGVVDTVGGEILATAIKSTDLHGTVTCCGNVASPKLSITVFPFILRGVRLIGIDSQNCPMDTRVRVWNKLAAEWRPANLDRMVREIPLADLDENIDIILKGGQKGRVIVNLDA